MLADPGAAFPNAVTESSIPDVVKPAMMETTLTVMDVQAPATRSAETDVLTLEKFATTDPATTTPSLLAAEPTADCQDAVTELPIQERSVMMPEETLLDQTPADPTALFLNAAMVLLTTCTVNFAIKEDETL